MTEKVVDEINGNGIKIEVNRGETSRSMQF